jgi:nanoRNase/pAp phosphatase (c-di-AMP/oligoRNAs hydrolase)
VFEGRALQYRIFNAPWDFTFDLGVQGMEVTDADFIVVWLYNHNLADTPYKVSLRSSERGVDTIPIAKHFKGNGHRNASGFLCATNPEDALAALT